MYRKKLITGLAVGASCAGLIPAAMAGATAPPGSASVSGYCAAHVALEAAFSGPDPSAIGPAVEAAQAVAPDEVAGMLADVLANNNDGPPTPAFIESYGQLLQWITDNCGFATLDIVATNYAYGGIADGDQIPAGVTVIHLDNQADEYHEFALFKRNEGTTESIDELMAMSEDELGSKVTRAGSGFAAPGTVGGTVVDLTPGDYIGLCSIPEGTTQEAIDQMMAAVDSASEGSAPTGTEGPPHFTLGMHVEFTVVEGGAATTGSERDDDDVDGHDAGHHRLTTQHPFQQPAAQRRAAGCCASPIGVRQRGTGVHPTLGCCSTLR